MSEDSIFPVPRGKPLASDMKRLFQDVREGRRETETRWSVERRASSFPICPRAFHICYRMPPSKRPFKDESFASQVATEMGEAMHLVLQRTISANLDATSYASGHATQHPPGIQVQHIVFLTLSPDGLSLVLTTA